MKTPNNNRTFLDNQTIERIKRRHIARQKRKSQLEQQCVKKKNKGSRTSKRKRYKAKSKCDKNFFELQAIESDAEESEIEFDTCNANVYDSEESFSYIEEEEKTTTNNSLKDFIASENEIDYNSTQYNNEPDSDEDIFDNTKAGMDYVHSNGGQTRFDLKAALNNYNTKNRVIQEEDSEDESSLQTDAQQIPKTIIIKTTYKTRQDKPIVRSNKTLKDFEDGHLNEQIKICRTLYVKSKHDNDWLQNLTLCKDYIRKYKMGYIRRTGLNYQIEEWANRQRKQHEKNTLALWKVQMLYCIHFKFNP